MWKRLIEHIKELLGQCSAPNPISGGPCVRHKFHLGKHQAFNGETWGYGK